MDIRILLEKMKEKKASDLHLKAASKPIIRKNKKLYLLDKNLPHLTHEAIQSMIEPLLNQELIDLYKKNKNIDFARYFKSVGRMRFCVFSQRGTIRVVARLIPESIPSIEELNLPSSLKKIVDKKHGLILITGATGSGKSTTAASLINYLNTTYHYHIVTVEDPIEYMIHDHLSCVTQREMSLDYHDSAKAFKNALRQDPDVIFFGELRDAESIATAVQASESGHLVISTLHTSTSLETFDRCVSYFSGAKQDNIRLQLAHSLQAVISQRLAPSSSGGLVPIVEILLNNTRMQKAFLEKKDIQHLQGIIEDSIESWGMQTFDQHIIQLISQGVLTEKTGLKYSSHPENVKLMCQGFNNSQNTSLLNVMKHTDSGSLK